MGALIKTRIDKAARGLVLLGFAWLVLAIAGLLTGQLRAQETAVVLLEPPTLALTEGQTDNVVVRIEQASNVYGVQFDLYFDAQKIKVLDGDEVKPGVQLIAGSFFAAGDGFEAANEANNEDGRLTYAHSLLSPAQPASGSGTLAMFEVEARQSGMVDLLLGPVILASADGAPLPVQLGSIPAGRESSTIAIAVTAEPALPQNLDADLTPSLAAPTDGHPGALPSATEARQVQEGASTATEIAPLTTKRERAMPTAAVQPATNAAPSRLPAEEPEPTAQIQPTPQPPTRESAVSEIAAVALQSTPDLPAVGDQAASSVAVIGQNRPQEHNGALLATPVPAASGGSSSEVWYAAVGLLLLSIAFVVVWFLRRTPGQTQSKN